MSYYRIAGITLQVNWENDAKRIFYYLRHDCSILPRSLSAFELFEEVPSKVDLEITAGEVEPYESMDSSMRIGNQTVSDTGSGFRISFFSDIGQISPAQSIYVSGDYSKARLVYHDEKFRSFDLQRIQHAFEGRVLHMGSIVLHGAAIEWNNKGYIFTGISGAGKSTQAHLWQSRERAIILNGDCPVLRRVEDNVVVCGTPWCGTSGEYLNRETPLDSVILVKQANRNSVRKLEGNEKFLAILSQVLRPNADARCLDYAIANLGTMIDSINVYELECTKDGSSVDELKKYFD